MTSVRVTTISRDVASDSASAIRQQYRKAVTAFVTLVSQVGGDAWSQPAIGVWTVRDLAGHSSRALLTVESYLDSATTIRDPALPDAVAYLQAASTTLADPAAVAERGRQAGAVLGDRPATAVSDIADRVLGLVDASPDDALVATPVGTMTLTGYLPTRTFELAVHGLDLAAAMGALIPDQLTGVVPACLRLAADLAAARGRGVEVLLALTGRRSLAGGFTVL